MHFAYLAEACVLVSRFSQLNISHFHAHFGTNSAMVVLLNHVLGGPAYSFTVHGPKEFEKVEAIGLPKKIDCASFVVGISSYGRSQLYRWCNYNEWNKIKVIHCGLDESFFSHAQQPIPEELRLVCVGRLCEQKGQLLLVEAASKLVSLGYKFKLVLVGDGKLRAPIEEAIKSDKLEGDDSDDYYQFSLDKTAGVSVAWSSSESITVELLDSNKTLIKSLSGTNIYDDDVLFDNLKAGTYYLHLLTGNNTVSNYDVELFVGPTDNVDNASQTPKDLGDLTATSVTQSDYIYTYSGFSDSDTYSFTLTEASVVDFTWTDGVGDNTNIYLGSGFGTFEDLLPYYNGDYEETVSYQRTLGAGTYEFTIDYKYISNAPASYNLTLTASEAPDAGNSLGEAQDLGLFSYSITSPLTIPIFKEFSEVVGGDDSDDYFKFTLDNTVGVSASWSSSETITVEILDSNGTFIKSLSSNHNDVLFENLNAGTYYLHLLTGNNTVSAYDLVLQVGPTDNVDNASQTPKDLGDLTTTPFNQSDYVHGNRIQDHDIYSLTLTEETVVDFTWTDGVGDDTRFQLWSISPVFATFNYLYNWEDEETVSYQETLGPGTYRFEMWGSGPVYAPASYDLTLTATPTGNTNDSPTDITLSNTTIDENEPINTEIGTLTTTDTDAEETFTYSLVAGEGDTDNSLFTIDGNVLRSNAIFDFEAQETYSIRVETTDSANNTYSEAFIINIEDINESIATLDIDDNGALEPQDYNLINLYSSQLDESEFDFLINNFSNDLIWKNSTRTDSSSIFSYLNEVGEILLDIDGNNKVELQDHNLINLYSSQLDESEFDFLINNFSNDLIGEFSTRTDATSIFAYFETITV